MEPATLSKLVAPTVASCGLEVDRVEILPAGRRSVVRIFLDGDGPKGRGPSLDEIADATRAISKLLDDSPVMGSRPWTLEVSSRGVSRPLTDPKHFRRNAGRLVQLTTDDGQLTARIVGVEFDELTVDADGARRTLPLAQVSRALVQVELNRSLNEGYDDSGDDEDEGE